MFLHNKFKFSFTFLYNYKFFDVCSIFSKNSKNENEISKKEIFSETKEQDFRNEKNKISETKRIRFFDFQEREKNKQRAF